MGADAIVMDGLPSVWSVFERLTIPCPHNQPRGPRSLAKVASAKLNRV